MTRQEFLDTFPEFIKNYQPAPEVLAQISKVKLLMVVGPSGVGKTTLINRSGIPYVPSDVTRAARPGEQNGVDMLFRTDYDKIISDLKAGQFVQVVLGASDDFYATSASSYPSAGWATMPVLADVVPIFRKLGFSKTISAFIVPPSYNEWMRRMGSHELEPAQLAKRLAEAKRSLDFALNDPETRFVLNDDVAKATARLQQVAADQAPDDEVQAKQIAQANYQKLLNSN